MAMSAVLIDELVKIYNPDEPDIAVRAVDSISFRIEPGESVAIMGPSGCGKSSLLHILGCLDRPTMGKYELAGRDVMELDEDELAALRNRHIGFVFQSFHLLPRMDALENVELPLLYAGVKKSRERAMEALERVGLKDRAHHMPNELSGGQKQRVAIARALVTKPSILLGDEPTGALDTKTGIDVLDLLQELNREGTTLICVTHDMSVARRMSRTLRMRDGKIDADGPSNEVLRSTTHDVVSVAC
jgi:putative ABC transport system ATP-binding protein